MQRRGSVLIWSLLVVILAGMVIHGAVQRWHEQQRWLQQRRDLAQARIYALSARHLPAASQHEIHHAQGRWILSHRADGRLLAWNEEGQGWWLRWQEGMVIEEGAVREEEPWPITAAHPGAQP
ncbi:MAG: hypothetical protein EA402_13760 [Planctomycetota bacterium]|nr:MAG: hypothetical protein EA402_13760 [Planctomycetota bacterium]